jgi:glycosyltransferase involved in cell wall biosynthesis
MRQPIRILHVLSSLDRGGAETMVINLYRKIDKSKIQFDFVVNSSNKEYDYESEIKLMGGRIFSVPRYCLSNHFSYIKHWKELLKDHPEWKIIHAHHTSVAIIYVNIARSLNRITIVHSHTAGSVSNIKSKLKILTRFPLRYKADYLFACSHLASKWMFGKHSDSAYIINNAIDVNDYSYSHNKRQLKRNEFNINNKFVIGHIGNFTDVKNYPFIIEVFYSVLKRCNNAILILVGNDLNNPNIKLEAKNMGLENKIIFTGVRSDVSDLVQAMDVFLFPSLHEGLPVTLIEAQASGLECIVSDTITNEVKITDQIEFISLHKTADYWADKILSYKEGYQRRDNSEILKKTGYDIMETAKNLEVFYLKMIK